MSHSEESENNNLQFNWGKKRGVGGAKKDIQFYESFTFDGTNYSLYDCVYLFKKGELEPYIGKIVKIWEQRDGRKKVKILWFFRPNELLSYLGDHAPLKKEIFLACGEGVGASNINPLEAIAGKCYVLCSSKDERNPQPSKEALEMADYIFYRIFDVGNCTISETIADNIVGVEVKYLLNRVEDLKRTSDSKLEANVVDGKGKTDGSIVSRDLSKSDSLRLLENKVKDDKLSNMSGSFLNNYVNEGKHLNEGKTISDEKSVLKLKNDSINDGAQGSRAAGQAEEGVKSPKNKTHSDLSDDRPSKKLRPIVDSVRPSDGLQNKNDTGARKLKIDYDEDGFGKDSAQLEKESSEKMKLSEKKPSPALPVENDTKTNNQIVEVTRRPDADRSKWFKQAPWEARLKSADERGTLVFLDNLDPSYTSGEIEDIIYHSFEQSCTARVIQLATFQNPNYGQAYIIFKTVDAADLAVRKINMGCLMLPNGRPLFASRGMLKIPAKSSTHVGHLTIDKIKLQTHEEWKKAVATSHCSQPNTIEYEMAMDWMLAQEKSARWFSRLHKVHGDERHQAKKSLKGK